MISARVAVLQVMANRLIRKPISIGLLAAIALLAIACACAHADEQMHWQSPAFELADSDGQMLHYPDDLSDVTIVLFWASWCPYCKALMPHLQSIIDEYQGEIPILALNFRDDEDPRMYISEYGFDFRLFPDGDPVAKLWEVKATPGLFLVDKTGLVVFSNYDIPETDYPGKSPQAAEQMKHYQKAARKAPFWAAQLRLAIDRTR